MALTSHVIAPAYNPNGMTTDGTYIYWIDPNADAGGTAIFRIPVGGGTAEKIFSGTSFGVEPIVEFSERIKRHRKSCPKENWFSRVTHFLRDTLELSMGEAANLTEEEWNTAVNVLS